ncbi:hypothetical protein HYH03_009626 [Edaphochlamys debaryana]|uniref:Vitamin K epoxide reductase domain-containing protein n=1 Tax=Edaphochlamys debaryana TaxID=47281 RepID=A0A835XYA4_9CHLO|nr:hypothetical protein HYH03_009626 [Edaphochlamys debaryana]|eukprot:KAG2492135.1 hypothetical protein HYH03_009626 [Edaphochlamys debaryana]
MIALSAVGAVETAYLTYAKLFDAPVACPTNGCESVLASPYAQLFGLPLPLFGFLAYAAVGGLAAVAASQAKAGLSSDSRQPVLTALTAGVAALGTTSAVLMTILQTRLGGTPCAWCYLSATLSATLVVTLLSTFSGKQLKDSALGGAGAALATAALLFVGMPAGSSGSVYIDDDFQLEYKRPVVTTESSDRAVALAARLDAAGARMYGAFWCSHCYDQKQEFGSQAMADFPYVECFPNGWKKGEKMSPLCDTAGVQAFPTWVIGGKKIEGELTLTELEKELDKAAAAAQTEVAAVAP